VTWLIVLPRIATSSHMAISHSCNLLKHTNCGQEYSHHDWRLWMANANCQWMQSRFHSCWTPVSYAAKPACLPLHI